MTIEQCRMARAALKWSWDDLAKASGLSRSTVARFESGKAVASENLQAMVDAFAAEGLKLVAGGVVRSN